MKAKQLLSYLPQLLIGLIVLVIAVINYSPGTWLSGWDNLHPEFNFSLNIRRSLAAVWQEYQGLGLLGGMGHASDLPRQVFLWFLSVLVPKSFLRYFYVYLTLFMGPLGVYYLVKNLLGKDKFTALLAAVLYLLNLATVQTFYFPFSAFATHFAFLPWLIFFFLKYLSGGGKFTNVQARYTSEVLKKFVLVSLLSIPQAYIPTLFIVYVLALAFLTLPYLIQNRNRLKLVGKRLAVLLIIVFSVNAFWLLPQIYFTFKNSHVVTAAKTNQMSTQENFLKNQKFGDLKNVALLKNFWFENTDINPSGQVEYVMPKWRKHLNNPSIQFLGYTLFCLVVFGFISSLLKKDYLAPSFATIFLLAFTMIANKTPPFSLIVSFFRQNLPLFSQIFRFPFTKFSTLLSLSFAVFFGLGFKSLTELVQSRIANLNRSRIVTFVLAQIMVGFFLILTLPIFQGYLFYPRLKIKIPHEYFELFDWFKKQNPNTRIANFPQYQFWGWNWYRFGYTGSGFLWYGIPQPILDRAFDVWNDKNEGFFWEVSQAIYSENIPLLENLIDKYQIKYLLLDKNIISPGNQKVLNIATLETMFEKSQKINLVEKFGQIEVYETKIEPEFKDFVSLVSGLPTVSPSFRWANIDTAFTESGSYATHPTSNLQPPTHYYPFRSLFTNNGYPENLEIETDQNITFSATLPALGKTALNLPNFALKEKIIPVEFSTDEENKILKLDPLLPKIKIGEQEVELKAKSMEIALPKNLKPNDFLFTLNQEKFSDSGYVLTDRPNEVHFFQKTPKITLLVGPESFGDQVWRCAPQKNQDQIKLEKDQEKITLKGKKAAPCVSLKFPLDFVSPGDLVKITFMYQSTQDEIPIYCLYSEERKNCLNQKEKKIFGFSGKWKVFEDYTVAVTSPSDTLDFRLWLDAYDQDSLKSISYKDIKIEVYPFVSKENISVNPQNFGQERQELKLNQPVEFIASIPGFEGLVSPPEAIGGHQFRFQAEKCAPFGSPDFTKEAQITDKQVIITYRSVDSNSCDYFVYEFLPHDLAYLLSFKTKNVSGLPLRVYTTNHQNQHAALLTYLKKTDGWQTQNLVLPPFEKAGRGYTITLENPSVGDQKTENRISEVKITPFPYFFLKGIKLESGKWKVESGNSQLPFEVKKKAIFWYQVSFSRPEKESLLVLSQSFDSGWMAFLGRKTLEHVLVNNWENGWRIEKSKVKSQKLKINIFYLPQVLESIGLGLLFGIIIYFLPPLPKPKFKLQTILAFFRKK